MKETSRLTKDFSLTNDRAAKGSSAGLSPRFSARPESLDDIGPEVNHLRIRPHVNLPLALALWHHRNHPRWWLHGYQ